MMYSQIAFAFLVIVGLTSALPKPKPKPPPPPKKCADVLLYDTFGDGWNSNVVFQAGRNDTYQLLNKFDSNGAFPSDQLNCSTRVLQFCDDKESYEFSVDTVNGSTIGNAGEVFWAVHYDHKMYYGTIGSSVVIKGPKVHFSDLYDESPRANKCSVCNVNITNGMPIKLRDARGNGWYSVGDSDVAGFVVPNVLIHSRYTVTTSDGTEIAEGTLCKAEEVICTESFQDGTYFIRFSGLSQGGESWEFCSISGAIGDELKFSIVGGSCLPHSKTSSTEQCYSNTGPLGPASIEVALEVQKEVFATVLAFNENKVNDLLSYFLVGTSICFLALVAAKSVFKKDEFVVLPTESAHSSF